MLIDISDVVRRSGLAASTLRYYEAQGLISAAGRHGLRRQYQPQVGLQITGGKKKHDKRRSLRAIGPQRFAFESCFATLQPINFQTFRGIVGQADPQ